MSVLLIFCLTGFLIYFLNTPLPVNPPYGRAILSKDGEILRLLPGPDGTFSLPVPVSKISPFLIKAFIAAEDRRFMQHFGVDPVALARAVFHSTSRMRVVSGASTISQQVIRLLYPRPRTIRTKFIEMFSSIKLEWQHSKTEIMELYLNLVPMGSNIRGVPLASRIYFGKDAGSLNLKEAAALASLPQAPARYNPFEIAGRRRLESRTRRVLERMLRLGLISRNEFDNANSYSLEFKKKKIPLEAPHVVNMVSSRFKNNPCLRTTIDLEIQKNLEKILISHRERLARRGVRQVAAIIADVPSMKIRALTGSLEYGKRALGFNNGATAPRSAGSTLKPFLYELAFEQGFSPASRIPDIVESYKSLNGEYIPLNANRTAYGPVTLRTALGNSLNLSSVRLLNIIGTEAFYRRLKELSIIGPGSFSASYYGLGMAIGNVEVTLLDLLAAYGALASLGIYRKPVLLEEDCSGCSSADGLQLMDKKAVYIVSDILADPKARLFTFGNPHYFETGSWLAIKTGTSNGYRDCWLFAYNSSRVLGIWAGNFDGSETACMSGATACGPILQDIIQAGLMKGHPLPQPDGLVRIKVCGISGESPGPACPAVVDELFMEGISPASICSFHRPGSSFHILDSVYASWLHKRHFNNIPDPFKLASHPSPPPGRYSVKITAPHDGDTFLLGPASSKTITLSASVEGPAGTVTWLVNGYEHETVGPPYTSFLDLKRGLHTITAMRAGTIASTITIKVE